MVAFLATKLYVPPPPPKAVGRARLLERLDEGLAARRKVSLISAPAGFGKTTLAAAWIGSSQAAGREANSEANREANREANSEANRDAKSSKRAAWLALDEKDGDPLRFLAYVTRALQTVAPGFGAGILESLQAPQPPPVEGILTALVNEIAAMAEAAGAGVAILVLDDYHVADSKGVDEALTFLVEHLPPQLHVAITTREDPQLPLHRLRARGQMTELRAADLRFTPAEAAAFLNEVMGLALTAAEVAALEIRTEGWIAGLQLAALSMQGRADVGGFIQAFAGDHRYIVDYLVEEVLARQPGDVRSFLLQTAILERLHGPLCEAVTLQEGGQARLEALQRGNFFVVPLDDRRQWYRYHHLFGDVLRMHLLAEQGDAVLGLHRRASEWYARHGMQDDAIRHALAGGDFEGAAGLIEPAIPELRRTRQEATMLHWLRALPEEVVRQRPVLCLHFAGALLLDGQYAEAETRLRDAEQLLAGVAVGDTVDDMLSDTVGEAATASGDGPGNGPGGGLIVVDEVEFRRVPGWIQVYRAGLALAQGDAAAAVQFAARGRQRLAVDDHLGRSAAAGLLGLAAWATGDLAAAYQFYVECKAGLLQVGYVSDALGCTLTLADIRLAQGRRHDARRHYLRGLELGAGNGLPLRGTADMYVGMAELAREGNDLAAAREQLLACEALGDYAGLPQNAYRRRVALAHICLAEGDAEKAIELLDAAERVYMGDLSPDVHPIAAQRARVWAAEGHLAEALAWVRERGLAAGDELNYLREYEHVTLARILLAQYRHDGEEHALEEASALLARLRQAAEVGERAGSVVEILVLEALVCRLQGDTAAALGPLARALALAEPEGYVRIFVDEGSPLAELLQAAAAEGIAPQYVARLLAAFGVRDGDEGDAEPHGRQGAAAQPAALLEPLSEREREVLRLLAADLSGPEIASTLYVSLNTLRTHTKNIYGKLGVTSRRAAVRRGEELGLL